MIKVVIFGGTTEGRMICKFCDEHVTPSTYCVATADGARSVDNLPNICVRIGRLSANEMTELLQQDKPALVVDATHPYATEVSMNIAEACKNVNIPLLRVARDSAEEQDAISFTCIEDLLAWLEGQTGGIFVTTGSTHAEALTRIPDYQNRVWLRILPNLDSLRKCLDLGYRPEQLVCMQGPFSEELNFAMFKNANTRILVTKNSGTEGGFTQKLRAAQILGMVTAVLIKPEEVGGISLEEACKQIMEIAK